MKTKRMAELNRFFLITILLVFASTLYMACGGAKQLTSEEQAVFDAAERAKQDSIAYQELLRNWSFGNTNYRNKEYDRVTKYFWKVIELDKNKKFKDVYSFLADTYFQTGKGDSAVMVLEKGVTVFPKNADMHRRIGYIFSNKQETERAISSYERVIELQPDATADLKILADLYLKTEQTPQALEAYKKLQKLEPDNPEYQERILGIMRMEGNSEAVVSMLLDKIKNDPENADAYMEVGNYYRNERNWAEAAKMFEKYHELKPDDNFVLEDLAVLHTNNENHKSAVATYDKILAKRPDDVRALTGQADGYRKMKQLRRALSTANKAIRADNSFGRAHIVKGEIFTDVVDQCQAKADRKTANFDDKLVFKMANGEFTRAKRDPAVRSRAESLMGTLVDVLPTKGDYFMNKDRKTPKSDCYSWLR